MLYSAEPHDFPMLLALGLEPWVDVAKGDEFLIGTVYPKEDESGRTRVQCFVTHFPARAFRFHIVRPSVEDDGGLEEIDVHCGGNYFTRYWPTALLVALDMVEVQPAKKYSDVVLTDPD